MSTTEQRLTERIEALQAKLNQAKEKRRMIEARKRAVDQKKRRADDTRRKILVGAAVLGKVQRNEWPEEKLRAMLDAELTRPDDRALFGLPELEGGPKKQ